MAEQEKNKSYQEFPFLEDECYLSGVASSSFFSERIKVNSKHILENWQRKIVAQTLYFRGPLLGVTRRSSWNKVKNLGGEPSMCLTLSCALVSPNNRGINFRWGMNVEVSRGKAWKHPGDRAVHGRVLRLTLIHPELSCIRSPQTEG